MELRDYIEWTDSTAIYNRDSQVLAIMYAALGLSGELCGEFTETFAGIYNLTKDDDEYLEEIEKLYHHIREEVGDVMWYIARMFKEMNKFPTEQDIFDQAGEKESCVIIAGQINNKVKKLYRDGVSDQALEVVFLLTVRLLVSMMEFCEMSHFDFNELLQDNVDKLESRKARGVIQGSGDNR